MPDEWGLVGTARHLLLLLRDGKPIDVPEGAASLVPLIARDDLACPFNRRRTDGGIPRRRNLLRYSERIPELPEVHGFHQMFCKTAIRGPAQIRFHAISA